MNCHHTRSPHLTQKYLMNMTFHCQKLHTTLLKNTELRLTITNCNFFSEKLHLLNKGNYKTLNEILNGFLILNEQLISFLLVQKSLLQQYPDLHLYPCPEVRHKRCSITLKYTHNIYNLESC